MTVDEPNLNVLALNSGSSSLKFGLYRVDSSRTEMLVSGEAESIGDKKSKFCTKDSRGNALLSETVSIPSQREAIIRIGRLIADSNVPAPAVSSAFSSLGGSAVTLNFALHELQFLPSS